jgi:hypothetical protein
MKLPPAKTMLDKYGVNWWWRTDDWWPLFRAGDQCERSAFLYELAARVDGQFEFAKPWAQLSSEQKTTLIQRWPMDQTHVGGYAVAIEGWQQSSPGWTPFQNMSWNLNLNDRTLISHFKDFIEAARFGLEMPCPKPNAGRKMRTKNSGVSWLPVELMDARKHVPKFVLNDAQRSQVSKSVRTYKASIKQGAVIYSLFSDK